MAHDDAEDHVDIRDPCCWLFPDTMWKSLIRAPAK